MSLDNFDILSFIDKKRLNLPLEKEEISQFVSLVARQELPDYQISAFLMAVAINGLSDQETTWLTFDLAHSGKTYSIPEKYKKGKIFVDKHSSGGIGDKTSLILLPIIVSAGLCVTKLSGRGLGFTGGTIDKLESVGLKTDLSFEEALKLVEKSGMFIISQTSDIAPVDKKLYALRDVTATVSSKPLIASSIMSKKMAFMQDFLFLDVKYGSGAFCKTLEFAKELSQIMSSIAKLAGMRLHISITSMQQPLGRAVGNAIEVLEAQKFLSGESTSPDLEELMLCMATEIFVVTGICKNNQEAEIKFREIINSGAALRACEAWFEGQGVDLELYKSRNYFSPKYEMPVLAKKSGYFSVINNEQVGEVSRKLGAGRMQETDLIDFQAGIFVHKKINDMVSEEDVIYTLYSSSPIDPKLGEELMSNTNIASNKHEVLDLFIPFKEQ